MKIQSIALKRSIAYGGKRYSRGDEEALDALLTNDQKKSLAQSGLVVLAPSSKSGKSKSKKDDAQRDAESVEA